MTARMYSTAALGLLAMSLLCMVACVNPEQEKPSVMAEIEQPPVTSVPDWLSKDKAGIYEIRLSDGTLCAAFIKYGTGMALTCDWGGNRGQAR